MPSLLGAGLLHCRLRDLVPPLQDDHDPQQFQLPSMAKSVRKGHISNVNVSEGLVEKKENNVDAVSKIFWTVRRTNLLVSG